MHPTFSIAIARHPSVIRRTAREASGNIVLGFAIRRTPIDPYSDRITCDMLNAGNLFSDACMKACLDALCQQFGRTNIQRAVTSWLTEHSKAEVPSWARTF